MDLKAYTIFSLLYIFVHHDAVFLEFLIRCVQAFVLVFLQDLHKLVWFILLLKPSVNSARCLKDRLVDLDTSIKIHTLINKFNPLILTWLSHKLILKYSSKTYEADTIFSWFNRMDKSQVSGFGYSNQNIRILELLIVELQELPYTQKIHSIFYFYI